ncbi:Glycosylphosphatidylinositol (GPI) anchor assembly protein [Coemansia nantahalensis]|uniref:Glycosylphosphatidylinositol (GPI) anchor assembly protein n=1 Tax=Coemansia nantahalensis TaxID=2789366 RepID=A0ACC1JY99_9FUNG|nr:Glycosylphosphatidylinositol (GPI) anchor assembly protein [Coemansia nantahalensis]
MKSLPLHKRYPIEPNGMELALGGMASALALASPGKGLNLYEHPTRYLALSASILFGYYAILAFADVYCFKLPGSRARHLGIGARVGKVLTTAIATALAAAAIAAVFVLFGAPAASKLGETAMAAVNVALLAVTPVVLTLKADASAWRRALLSTEPKSLPEKWAAGIFWCTMLAAWSAALFIPMDWDRPWQRWPIPIVGGAYLGNLVGLVFVLIRCFVLPLSRARSDAPGLVIPDPGLDPNYHGPVTRSMAKKDE